MTTLLLTFEFLLFGQMALEFMTGCWLDKAYPNRRGLFRNMVLGIAAQCLFTALLVVTMELYRWLGEHAITQIPTAWYTVLLLFVAVDLVAYLYHRLSHTLNVLWAGHITYHSTTGQNLLLGLRSKILSKVLQLFLFNWVFVALGFSPETVISVAFVHIGVGTLLQLVEIKALRGMGKVLVTPAHVRVHHAVNPQYIDRNFSECFIVWDRLFGTFAPEVDEVYYGVNPRPEDQCLPFFNFQYFEGLWIATLEAPRYIDMVTVWFLPLQWRQDGLPMYYERREEDFLTVEEEWNLHSRKLKHARIYTAGQVVWWFFLLRFEAHLVKTTGLELLAFGALLFGLGINVAGLLEARKWALLGEVGRNVLMGGLLIEVLQRAEIADWIGGITALVCLLTGISVVYLLWGIDGGRVVPPMGLKPRWRWSQRV